LVGESSSWPEVAGRHVALRDHHACWDQLAQRQAGSACVVVGIVAPSGSRIPAESILVRLVIRSPNHADLWPIMVVERHADIWEAKVISVAAM
jgi:hypothetical protein